MIISVIVVVVGCYDFVETMTSRSVRVRVYTPVGKKEQGKFALDVAVKSLNYYEDYFQVWLEWLDEKEKRFLYNMNINKTYYAKEGWQFQVAYPLSKMDLITIPNFLIGAMENWGLITFRWVGKWKKETRKENTKVCLYTFFVGFLCSLYIRRETRLLCDPANTTTQQKKTITSIIAHEIAHMWFGNLVTMVSSNSSSNKCDNTTIQFRPR